MKPIAKSSILIFIIVLLTGLASYIVRILFARSLTLAEYGLFYAVFAFVFFFAPFRDLGLSESSVFFINKYLTKNDKSRIKGIIIISIIPQLIFGLTIGLILFLLKKTLVIYYFKDPLAEGILTILIILFMFNTILPSIGCLFSAYQKVIHLRLNELCKFVVILISASILFKGASNSYMVPAWSYLIGMFVITIIYIILFYSNFKDILYAKANLSIPLRKEVFAYAKTIMFSTAAGMLLIYSDTIILTIIRGSETVGLYNIAYPAINIILLLIMPITIILFPKISHMFHNNNTNGIKTIISIIYNNLLIFSLPLGLVFFAYPELIILTLFGAKYLAASNALRVFALGFIFMAIRDINFAIIAGIGKVKDRSKILFIGAAVNIVLDIILITLFGATGAAIATAIGFALMAYLTIKLILKNYLVKINYAQQLKTILSSCVFIISILILKQALKMSNMITEAIIVLIISGIVYIVALVLFKVLTKNKFKEICDLVF